MLQGRGTLEKILLKVMKMRLCTNNSLSHDTIYGFNHAEYDCVHLLEGNVVKLSGLYRNKMFSKKIVESVYQRQVGKDVYRNISKVVKFRNGYARLAEKSTFQWMKPLFTRYWVAFSFIKHAVICDICVKTLILIVIATNWF